MLTRGTSALWPSAISSLLSQYINLFFWVLGWTLSCLDDTVLKNQPLFPGMFALQSCRPWDLTISFLHQPKLNPPRSRDCTLPPSVLTAPRILNSAIAWSLHPWLPLMTMSSTNPSVNHTSWPFQYLYQNVIPATLQKCLSPSICPSIRCQFFQRERKCKVRLQPLKCLLKIKQNY